MKSPPGVKIWLLVVGVCIGFAPCVTPQETRRHRRAGRPVLCTEGVLRHAVAMACSEMGNESCRPVSIEADDLNSDLVHYVVTIQVGPNPFDRILLHRVVQEHWSGLPRSGRRAVMLMPSHVFPWERFYLPPSCPGDDPVSVCAAATLAQRGIDVWGVDFRMLGVPEETDDFAFMEQWDMSAMMADIRVALRSARLARGATVRLPSRGLHLLGFGRSVQLLFALADFETQLPMNSRSISGLVSVDQAFQYDSGGETARQNDCAERDFHEQSMNAGDFEDSNEGLRDAGELALTDPDGPSPNWANVTNYEYALLVGCATYLGDDPVPHYHLVAGELDDEDKPIRLIYTEPERWIATMASAIPHESHAFFFDTGEIACGETDVPYDDHLPEVTVPVLYIGAAGGYGEIGVYSTTLLGSTDVTTILIQHQTAENAILDFGHGDIWFSAAAETEAWAPLADWIEAH